MYPMMEVVVAFSLLNSALLLFLLYMYARIAIRSRAVHAIGLTVFAVLLLANSVLTIYSYVTMAPLFGRGALPDLFMISVLETAGLAALVKVTW